MKAQLQATPATGGLGSPASGAESILQHFGGDASWVGEFRAQLAPTGVLAVLHGADSSTVKLADTAPFRSLSPAEVAKTKDALWNTLAPCEDRQRVWVALFDAGLVPDAPAEVIRAQRGGPALGGQGAPSGSAAASSGGAATGAAARPSPPPPSAAAKAPPPAVNAPPAAPSSAAAAAAPPPAAKPAPPAPAPSAPTTSAPSPGAAKPAPPAPPAPPPSAAAAPAAGAKASAPPPPPAPAALAPADKSSPAAAAPAAQGVDAALVKDLLTRALAPRMGLTSGRYLGRGDIMKSWPDTKIASLVRGIGAAQQFYPMFAPPVLAQLVVAEGAQESTGDSTLLVGGQPGDGQGFMQVTWQSVVQDFLHFGQPIKALDGSVVVDPGNVAGLDLGDVAQNVALWAWYTRNTVGSRQSLAERFLWRDPPYNNAPSNVVVDFGNAQLIWLAGPRNDRHTPEGAGRYKDYHDRIYDYFTQSNFDGGGKSFDDLMATPLSEDLILAARRPGQDPNHWPPAA